MLKCDAISAECLSDALREFLGLPVGAEITAGLRLWVYDNTGETNHWHWCCQMAERFYGLCEHDPYIDCPGFITERRLEFARRLIDAIENGEYEQI